LSTSTGAISFYYVPDTQTCEICPKADPLAVLNTPTFLVMISFALFGIFVTIASMCCMNTSEKKKTKAKKNAATLEDVKNKLVKNSNDHQVNRDGSVTFFREDSSIQDSVPFNQMRTISYPVATVTIIESATIPERKITTSSIVIVKASNPTAASITIMRAMQVKLKTLISFGQIAINIGFNLDVVYPDLYAQFLASLGIVNFDLVPSLGLQCRFNSFDYIDRMLAVTISPLIIAFILGIFYIVIVYFISSNVESDKELEKRYPIPENCPSEVAAKLTAKDMKIHRRSFAHCDKNGGGTIDMSEVALVIREFDPDVTASRVQELIKVRIFVRES